MCGTSSNMSKIHEMLLTRRKEVLAEITPLKAELKEIDTALAAIGGEVPSAPSARTGLRQGSISSNTLAILQDHPEGLATRAITAVMLQRFGREMAPRNMSWHLSHLKRDQHVVLDGDVWRIPGSNNEAPDDPPSSASDNGGGSPSSVESRDALRGLLD